MERDLYERMARTQARHWWFCARREVLKTVVAGLGLPPNARILELGCGPGGNLEMLKGFGQVEAVEMDEFAREHARMTTGVNVKRGALPDDVPFEDGRFDLVCLLDVLEHVNDDEAALAQVRRLLKADGKVLLTVPAYQWLYGAHDRAHHHYRRYRKSELERKAGKAGLRPLRSGYYNTLLFAIVVLGRVAERVTGTKMGDETAIPPRWLNSILYHVFSIERMIVRHVFFPFGTSAIAVLRPK